MEFLDSFNNNHGKGPARTLLLFAECMENNLGFKKENLLILKDEDIYIYQASFGNIKLFVFYKQDCLFVDVNNIVIKLPELARSFMEFNELLIKLDKDVNTN